MFLLEAQPRYSVLRMRYFWKESSIQDGRLVTLKEKLKDIRVRIYSFKQTVIANAVLMLQTDYKAVIAF